jgi:hypothetical protein
LINRDFLFSITEKEIEIHGLEVLEKMMMLKLLILLQKKLKLKAGFNLFMKPMNNLIEIYKKIKNRKNKKMKEIKYNQHHNNSNYLINNKNKIL